MQLKKKAIRKMPDYHPEQAPHGLRRKPSDYNQKNNLEQRHRNQRGDQF